MSSTSHNEGTKMIATQVKQHTGYLQIIGSPEHWEGVLKYAIWLAHTESDND